ncbi:MAG: hypothetical protein ACR2PH_16550, partial [Desulfobulbia bacterium]
LLGVLVDARAVFPMPISRMQKALEELGEKISLAQLKRVKVGSFGQECDQSVTSKGRVFHMRPDENATRNAESVFDVTK